MKMPSGEPQGTVAKFDGSASAGSVATGEGTDGCHEMTT